MRTPVSLQNNSPGLVDLQNVFQATPWPDKRYNTLAQVSTREPTTLNSVDATGKVGGVRFFVSGSYQDEQGAVPRPARQQPAPRPREPRLRCAPGPHDLGELAVRQRLQRQPRARASARSLRGAAGHGLPRDRLARPPDPRGCRRFTRPPATATARRTTTTRA